MRPSQAILRPLTQRVLTGAGVRYARNVNAGGIQKRSILSLKDHVVSRACPTSLHTRRPDRLGTTVLLQSYCGRCRPEWFREVVR